MAKKSNGDGPMKSSGRAESASRRCARSQSGSTRSRERPSRSSGTICSPATRCFATLEETLRAQYPGVKFVSWREFGSTHAVNEKELLASLPQRFKELGVDAAISSMAC